jgi:folate-binding protein YgfZ
MIDAASFRLNGVAPLPHLGVIRVKGEDAAKFLQGQLTQDFVLLEPSQARLAAFCSAKGRMQASFIGFRPNADEILLVCSRDILIPTVKRLSMFVLRAKVRLTDATPEFELAGLAGDAISRIATNDHQTLGTEDYCGGTLIGLHPAGAQKRALWIAAAQTPLPPGAALDTGLWQWGEVASGIAMVTAPIVDAFVPQMLNYESVGGVNFKKGCYPGQEVVARSQFRGTLKRRAFLVHGESAMVAGQDVYSSRDPEQPCGLVAQAAASPFGGHDAIVSLQISAVESGDLCLGSPQGPILTVGRLPYPLLDDI